LFTLDQDVFKLREYIAELNQYYSYRETAIHFYQIVANRQTGNNNNVYHLDDFDKLDKIVDAILVKIGENKLEGNLLKSCKVLSFTNYQSLIKIVWSLLFCQINPGHY